MFHILKYVKILQEAGVPREQVETQIQIMTEIMENTLATKQDLKDESVALRHDFAMLKQDFAMHKQEVAQDFAMFKQEVKQEFELFRKELIQSEQRMTIRLGSIVAVGSGVAAALTKLLG